MKTSEIDSYVQKRSEKSDLSVVPILQINVVSFYLYIYLFVYYEYTKPNTRDIQYHHKEQSETQREKYKLLENKDNIFRIAIKMYSYKDRNEW